MRRFMLVGKTGVGKSSFINSTFGQYLAKTSEFEACTKLVEYHAHNTPIGDICFIDTPGLAEDDNGLDKKYLSLIRGQVDLKQVNAIIYVTRLDETRFRPDEKQTLSLLTSELEPSIWNRSWLVLTFAASVPNEHRQEVTCKRVKDIESFLQNITMKNRLTQPFKGFQLKLRVDNLVSDWSQNKVPILSVLTKQV